MRTKWNGQDEFTAWDEDEKMMIIHLGEENICSILTNHWSSHLRWKSINRIFYIFHSVFFRNVYIFFLNSFLTKTSLNLLFNRRKFVIDQANITGDSFTILLLINICISVCLSDAWANKDEATNSTDDGTHAQPRNYLNLT